MLVSWEYCCDLMRESLATGDTLARKNDLQHAVVSILKQNGGGGSSSGGMM